MQLFSEMRSIREGRDGKRGNDACMRPVALSQLPRGACPGWKVCETAHRRGRLVISTGAPEDAEDHDTPLPVGIANGTLRSPAQAHKSYRLTPPLQVLQNELNPLSRPLQIRFHGLNTFLIKGPRLHFQPTSGPVQCAALMSPPPPTSI